MEFIKDLNDQQRAAVQSGEGPIMIVAGPGTGKTKTLTARIAYQLYRGANPKSLVALTFTTKAAGEMRERVSRLIEGEEELPLITTFHALCHQILRDTVSEETYDFITESARMAMIRDVPKPRSLSGTTVRELGLAISQFKGQLDPETTSPIARLVEAYDAQLRTSEMMDFDDLLRRTYLLLQENEIMRTELQDRFAQVLVDEFQDTSELQWALVRQLHGGEQIFVIGDPRQSIYGFRGAGEQMFERFKQDFAHARQIALTTNYRSAKNIVRLGNAVFDHEQPLMAFSDSEGSVQAIKTPNEYSEADLVIQLIERGIGGSDMLTATANGQGRSFGDFAILYRTHRAARIVQQRLQGSGMPYQVVGEGSPYEQPDVQAIIGALQWLSGGALPEVKGLRAGQVEALLCKIDRDQPVSGIAREIIATLHLETDENSRRRLAQFVATLVRFDDRADSLTAACGHLAQLQQQEFYDPSADAVTLLTIHAAKGLEFTHVILIAAEEGMLPHIRKTVPTDFDEERRLFFVATTRAREQLDIIHVSKRGGHDAQPSRFISTIDEAILPRTDDPNLVQLQARIKKRQQKARQASLFS